MANLMSATNLINELREFTSFTAAEQRYIKCSLDIGLNRHDACELWARTPEEHDSIFSQYTAYEALNDLRGTIPGDINDPGSPAFLARLTLVTTFDLAQQRLTCFSAYRFLYERLIGARVRPWLPAAFCAASTLPVIHPDQRKLLLRSISESAATATSWSEREPCFIPEWVEIEPV